MGIILKALIEGIAPSRRRKFSRSVPERSHRGLRKSRRGRCGPGKNSQGPAKGCRGQGKSRP